MNKINKNNIVLIGNDCVAARIYERNKLRFNHPFMWSRISLQDYIKLLNINLIDENVSCSFELSNFHGKQICRCVINGDIIISYIHYVFSGNLNLENFEDEDGVNISCLNILDYCKCKFYKRFSLMKEEGKLFVYLYSLFYEHNLSKDDLLTIFQQLNNCNKRILIIIPNKYTYIQEYIDKYNNIVLFFLNENESNNYNEKNSGVKMVESISTRFFDFIQKSYFKN